MQKKKKPMEGEIAQIYINTETVILVFPFVLDFTSGPATVWPGASHCSSVTLVFICNMNGSEGMLSLKDSFPPQPAVWDSEQALTVQGRAGQSKAGLELRSPAHDLLLASRRRWPGYHRNTRLVLKHSVLFCWPHRVPGRTGANAGLLTGKEIMIPGSSPKSWPGLGLCHHSASSSHRA